MVGESAEFEKWLRQADADMRESVESAIDVEADLVAFKQKAFAQVVAVAHVEGNDAPDKAVRSVLAGVDVVDDCVSMWTPSVGVSDGELPTPGSLLWSQIKSAHHGSGCGVRLSDAGAAKTVVVRVRRRDAVLLAAAAAVVGLGAVAASIWGIASVATGLLAVTSAAVAGIAAAAVVRLGRTERRVAQRSGNESSWLTGRINQDAARRAYIFDSMLLTTMRMTTGVSGDGWEKWVLLTAKDCAETEAPPSEDRQGDDRPSQDRPSQDEPLYCVSGHDPGAVSVRASHRRRRSGTRRSPRTRPPTVNGHA